jgi:protein-tyrosine phosphatase
MDRTPFAYRVADRLLAGSYPGRWTDEESVLGLRALRNAGVTLFVDLTMPGELPPYHHLLGDAHHLRWPIPDMDVPSPAHMATLLDAIDAERAAAGGIYLHCWAGRGRTGTVVGCWLVRHGLAGVDALTQIVSLRRALADGYASSPQTGAQRAMVLGWKPGT